jgi:hypothetical protein
MAAEQVVIGVLLIALVVAVAVTFELPWEISAQDSQ